MSYTLSNSSFMAGSGYVLPFLQIFEAQRGVALVLSPELVILAASETYVQEVQIPRAQLLNRNLFEVFPEQPSASGNGAADKLRASLEQVLQQRRPHQLHLHRYDLPDNTQPDRQLERYWSITNTPILDDDGKVLCILHEPENVTLREKAGQLLQESREREQAALAEAKQQRLRLERLFNQAPAALALLEGPDLVFKVINKGYQQLFPGRQLLNLPLFEALSELKGQPIEHIARHVYQTGETFEGKEVLVPLARYEGQPPEDIYWNFIYQATFDAQGQVNGMLIFALDVTTFLLARQQVEQTAAELQTLNQELEARVEHRTHELKMAELEAERQKTRLENLFMQAPSAIVILDGPDMVFQLVNPVYQQIFPGRDLLNKPLLEALPEVKDTPIPGLLRHVYETGETYEAQEMSLVLARHQGAEPEEIFWNFIYQARRNPNGEIDGILAYAHEVTEQVKARRSVEASARQLRLITDSLPVLIGYLDKEERYQFANKAYMPWFNTDPEKLIGRKVRDVVGEAAYNNVKGYIDRALAGERLDFEATMPYREGFVKHIHTSYVPDIRNGAVEGFYTLVTDITEQVEARKAVEQSAKEARKMAVELVKANQELRQVNQQLTHINTDLDNFIYTASHDLRAPISNIEMLMQELLDELPADNRPGMVNQIVTMMDGAINRFKRTVESLTEITKLQKQSSTKTKRIHLDELVAEVLLDLEPLIRESGAEVQTGIEEKATLSFAEKNLRSIVYNLVSNAIKYRHPERRPQVSISCRKTEGNLLISVRDNGLGLKPGQRGKLFSMFRRFHNHVEGSGVGLYMVKRIVDNAGGRIEVETEHGQGTTFHVYLPARK